MASKRPAFTSPNVSNKKGKPIPENTGTNGVKSFDHMIRDMVTPYGSAKNFDVEKFFNILQPQKCEWLRRPIVAMSQLIHSIKSNTEYISGTYEEVLNKVTSVITSDASNNNITDELMTAIFTAVKNLTEVDIALLNTMFKEGNAMMMVSFHLLSLKALADHPEQTSSLVEAESHSATNPPGFFQQHRNTDGFLNFLKTNKAAPKSWEKITQERKALEEQAAKQRAEIDALKLILAQESSSSESSSSSSSSESEESD